MMNFLVEKSMFIICSKAEIGQKCSKNGGEIGQK